MVSSCLLWVLLLGTFGGVNGAPAVFDVQAEEGQGFDPANVHWRSNAEGKQAVWLRNDERLSFTFCLPADDNITVLEIRFSSDGAEKEGAVLIDGTEVGMFRTANNSDHGLNWDQFNTTSGTFETVSLSAGEHTLDVVLMQYMDDWGIEIDQLMLSFGSNITKEEIVCGDAGVTSEVTEDVTEATPSKAEESTETSENAEGVPAENTEEAKAGEGESAAACEGEC